MISSVEVIASGTNDFSRRLLRGIKRGLFSTRSVNPIVKCVIYCDTIPSFLICSSFLQLFHPTVIVYQLRLNQKILKISAGNTLVSSPDGLNNTAIITACQNISIGFANGTMNSSI